MRSRSGVLSLVALGMFAVGLPAQVAQHGPDPLARALFPPELVLQHAEEIGLRPEQRTLIVNLMKETHSEMLDFQLAMSERHTKLMKELGSRATVNENAVLALVDSVLAGERAMKRRQMLLLVRIKNALSQQQQDRLQELRKPHEGAAEAHHEESLRHAHAMSNPGHHGLPFDHGRGMRHRLPGVPESATPS